MLCENCITEFNAGTQGGSDSYLAFPWIHCHHDDFEHTSCNEKKPNKEKVKVAKCCPECGRKR